MVSPCNQGDIFIQKAPACTIDVLAQALSGLFDVPADIEDIGIRHGEKLHETLATREELALGQDHGRYLRLPLEGQELDYEPFVDMGADADILREKDFDSDNVRRMTVEEMSAKLLEVPEVRRRMADAGRDVEAAQQRYAGEHGVVG